MFSTAGSRSTTGLGSVAGWGLLLCALAACRGGGGGGGTGSHDELAEAWSNSAPWCNKQRECNVLAEGCEDGWPSRTEVEEAVAQLSETAVDRCLRSTQAEDNCALPLSCTEFTDYAAFWGCPPGTTVDCCIDHEGQGTDCPPRYPCEAEHAAILADCEALNRILAGASTTVDVAGEWPGT